MQFKKISIIVSKTDSAGMNIAGHLIKEFNFAETGKQFDSNSVYSCSFNGTELELIFINQKQVFADYLDEIKTDLLVFASKHSSSSEQPALSVHPIGNFSSAGLGGKEKTLVKTSSLVLKNFFLNLLKEKTSRNFSWPVLMEQTHHGPFLSKPAVFIEIGSSELEWNNSVAGKIVSSAIINSFSNFNSNFKTALGVGGTHYCPEFSKIMERTEIAVSHILSKYFVEEADFSLFKQMLSTTIEKTDLVLFDWKGLNSEQRKKIISFCVELKLEYKKTRDFL
ncbi:MAG: D-aminoacyl-tRNA deacylase [archaeon]